MVAERMKKLLITAPIFLLVGVMLIWQVSKSRTFQFFGVIVPRINTSENVIALTFDDGPTSSGTDEILRVLDEMKARPLGKKLLAFSYYLSKTGRRPIMWDVEPDSNPEIASDSRRIIEETRSRVRPGSIILLHVMYQSRQQSLQAVRGIIESLEREGCRFVTVSELLAAAN
jgi:peptidoglycan/xylan/chitin deacetylase (PgdA/CDA1 family)